MLSAILENFHTLSKDKKENIVKIITQFSNKESLVDLINNVISHDFKGFDRNSYALALPGYSDEENIKKNFDVLSDLGFVLPDYRYFVKIQKSDNWNSEHLSFYESMSCIKILPSFNSDNSIIYEAIDLSRTSSIKSNHLSPVTEEFYRNHWDNYLL